MSPRRPRSAGATEPSVSGRDSDALAFMRWLWAIDHRLRSLSKQMQERLGITGPQRLVLRLVGRAPGVTPSQLAGWLHLDRGTLTGILVRLESRRLLSREPHPEDGRSVTLRVSREGRRLDREMVGTVEECVRRALATLDRAQIEAATQVLDAVARELEAEARGGPEA